MPSYWKFAALLAPLIFQGCITVPKQEVENNLQAPVVFSDSVQKALSSTVFVEGEWPSEKWWEIFQDPQLSRYIEMALEDSPTMQHAQAKVETALEFAKLKRSSLLPNLSFNTNSNWQYLSKNGFFRSFAPQIPATVDDIWFTFNLFYDLDLFGSTRERFRAALGEYHASEAERAGVQLFLSAAVAKAYFELQANIERRTLLSKTANRRKALLLLHADRKKYGLDTQIDLLEAEKELLEIEKLLSKTQENIELNEHMMKVLMGHSPDGGVALQVLHIPFEDPIALPSDLSLNLLSRRPDLMAQIWRVEAAAHEIGAAKADFYPNINLMAFAGFESLHFNQLLSWSSRAGSANPAISLPLFTGGQLKANLKSKWAEFHQQTAAYHEILLTAAQEVVDQLTILLKLNDQLRIQNLTVENLLSHTNLSRARYLGAVSPYMEALQTEERLFDVELELVDLKLIRRQACVNLIKGLGGGYHQTAPLTPSKKEGASG
ncbi:MAG: efflux transporter outer membrane subunit [Chlamydiales bacterium]|nr:efflux transporter outer membrane subunit [Chlamydiales bacterium]